jgi:hypothetical protein
MCALQPQSLQMLDLGMNQAETIIFKGTSAGGLATMLHVDMFAQRMKTDAPNARVVGMPDAVSF